MNEQEVKSQLSELILEIFENWGKILKWVWNLIVFISISLLFLFFILKKLDFIVWIFLIVMLSIWLIIINQWNIRLDKNKNIFYHNIMRWWDYITHIYPIDLKWVKWMWITYITKNWQREFLSVKNDENIRKKLIFLLWKYYPKAKVWK